MFIRIYNFLIRILYPLVIKRYINKRKQNGKEDIKRFNERIGRPKIKRPEGKLNLLSRRWMSRPGKVLRVASN